MKLRKQLSGTAFKIINEKIQYERFKWGKEQRKAKSGHYLVVSREGTRARLTKVAMTDRIPIKTTAKCPNTLKKGNIDISKRARKHALDVNEERQHVNPNETRTANNLSPPVKTKCLNR
ncbi:hypothetical protein WUBG_02368 [Wuchereria bancrofti]|uniref:Uncharacterized protein n=1 Tax=Wuchereria bancrofti TaxID=6293 RepID=J9FHB0_WUCBA|nr:hypothetical protein WUBG_02368 [Wuchereria bancrofti]